MAKKINIVIVSNNFCSPTNIGSKRWRELSICLRDRMSISAICSDGDRVEDARIGVEHVPLGTELKATKSGFLGRASANPLLRLIRYQAASLLCWPDRQRKWSERAINRVGKFLRADCINIIVTSGPLFSAHTELLKWRRRCGESLFWVMDLRDPWTNEPNPRMQRRFPKALMAIERRMEQQCHDGAEMVTTIGEKLAALLHRDFGSEPVVLYNGYLKSEVRPCRIPSRPLELCYLGTILRGLYNPELLFKAAADLEVRRSGLEFSFRCSAPDVIERASRKWDMQDSVTYGGFVRHSQSLYLQENAGANILLSGTDSSCDHWITGKIFELITANRPILAVAGRNSEIRTVLKNVGVESIAWDDHSAQALLLEFLAGRAAIPNDRMAIYARETAANTFFKAIERMISSKV